MLRALLFSLVAVTAQAADQCAIPRDIPVPKAKSGKPGGSARIADYQFVLSWSPYHCSTARNNDNWDYRFQCEHNQFGFVVHGLWPQGADARSVRDHPRNCRRGEAVPPEIVRANLCTVPGAALMQHEWQSHGTCGWNSPQAYFGKIQELAQRYKPAAMRLATGPATAGDVRRAVMAANPALLRPQHVGIRIKRDLLQEAYICLDLKYAPTACSGRQLPDHVRLTVPAAR